MSEKSREDQYRGNSEDKTDTNEPSTK